MRFWKRVIFSGNGREEEKAAFILDFKKVVIIKVARTKHGAC